MTLKTIIVDGLSVETTDAAEKAIIKLQGQLADSKAALDAKAGEVVKLTAEAVAKDAEIVTLKQAVADAKVTPQQMRDAAKAFATTLAKAKALAPALTIGDEMDEAAVKKAVVVAKMGDAAKAYTDEHVTIAFDTLAVGVKVEATDGVDPLRQVIGDGVQNMGDAETKAAREARDSYMAYIRGEDTKAA